MKAARSAPIAPAEFRQIFPQPGWVEHDPFEIRDTQFATAREAIAAASLAPPPWPRWGSPKPARDDDRLGNAPAAGRSTRDRLAGPSHEPICEAIRARGLAPLVAERTGIVVDAYSRRARSPGCSSTCRARARGAPRRAGFRHRRQLARLAATRGAVHATDVTNASRTLLYDIVRGLLGRRAARCLRRAALDAARCAAFESSVRDERCRRLGGAWPIAGIAGDSRRRSSDRRAFARGWRRTPTAPAASC